MSEPAEKLNDKSGSEPVDDAPDNVRQLDVSSQPPVAPSEPSEARQKGPEKPKPTKAKPAAKPAPKRKAKPNTDAHKATGASQPKVNDGASESAVEEEATSPEPAKQPRPKPEDEAPPGPDQRAETPQPDPRTAMRQLRRRRAWKLVLKFALGVLLPTALAGTYYWGFASDLYESTSMFTIQSADGRSGVALDSLLGAIPATSPAARDTLAVRDHILSRDMLSKLDAAYGFSEHYQQENYDWLARLPKDASFEDAYDYYLSRLAVDYDSTSGVLTVKVKAFSPDAAVKFTDGVLHYSEEMVNQLSERSRRDQTKYALSELKQAEERLSEARQRVLALQGERAEFNPQQSAEEALSIRGQLKADLARVRAELSQARAYMAPTAPKVIALQQQAASLAAQVSNESRRLVNPGGERGLNESIASFEDAMIEKEFAQSAYQSALTSLEIARNEAVRQHRYLARIAQPSTPDEATYPRRFLGTLTVLILSLALVGISSLLLAAVREHAKI